VPSNSPGARPRRTAGPSRYGASQATTNCSASSSAIIQLDAETSLGALGWFARRHCAPRPCRQCTRKGVYQLSQAALERAEQRRGVDPAAPWALAARTPRVRCAVLVGQLDKRGSTLVRSTGRVAAVDPGKQGLRQVVHRLGSVCSWMKSATDSSPGLARGARPGAPCPCVASSHRWWLGAGRIWCRLYRAHYERRCPARLMIVPPGRPLTFTHRRLLTMEVRSSEWRRGVAWTVVRLERAPRPNRATNPCRLHPGALRSRGGGLPGGAPAFRIYGGNPAQLSVTSVAARFVELANQYGSLTRGVLAARARRGGSTPPRRCSARSRAAWDNCRRPCGCHADKVEVRQCRAQNHPARRGWFPHQAG